MMTISSYQLVEEIYQSANSLVYRGLRNLDRQPVILKILKSDYATPQEITRYKQEYEITRNLNKQGIVKVYGLENYQNSLAIILEDFGGESLKIWIKDQKVYLEKFLIIAIKIADSLSDIHASNIIHKDINPSNIVFNPATGQLKIIDFGIATLLSRENITLYNPLVLEGTLAYISPEQTGRMNRAIDYRTDFYSLGVTFYELLTHQLPFNTSDAMELVHSHIALTPIAPHDLNSDIPKAVSDIVMKLLAKSAEERYQSAWGLKADLQECLTQLQNQGQITEFSLGSQDISDKFQIPQKLYGREKEVETLLAAFERVAAAGIERGGDDNSPSSNPHPQSKIEIMLIAGYSGIGKSALVQELYKPITRLRGYFISGKFDQLQRNIPYSAFVNAFRGLVRQLLTESETQLAQWREKLLAALGPNGQVIIDVIPEVELIVGSQPPVAELGIAEAQNRFNLVFQNFIRVFCQPEHPLVIFLDDLQWSDLATLKLIELIMTDDQMQYLFLIGAYRDNEVSPIHPLMMTLEALGKQGAIANHITLSPLQIDYVTDLIAETLHSDTVSVKPLAELVVRKTKGNPFFVNQFLTTLYQENLLTFTPPPNGGWQWDTAKIEAVDITDNVVKLMSGKLKKLPDSTQQVSRLAACVGNQFNLNTLSLIYEKSVTETFQELFPAIEEGLILPISELNKSYANVSSPDLLILNYKFLHDRVQQAAYALIDEEDKKAVHLRIGRLLLANLSTEERLERIFELVDHLNLGRELITSDREQIKLAKLNLAAGQKAKDATAYAAARNYLNIGMEKLSPASWNHHYELMFALHKERAEIEYLNGNFEQSEFLSYLILEKAKSAIEKADIYKRLIVQYTLIAKYSEALQTGREALALLGMELPEANLQAALDVELAQAKARLGHRRIDSLINQPEMTIPETISAVKLLDSLLSSTYISYQELFMLLVVKLVNLSLKYGHIPESASSYAFYGLIVGYICGDYKSGHDFCLLGLELSKKFNTLVHNCKASAIFGAFVNHWVKPIKTSYYIHQDGYKAGLESGELLFAGYIVMNQLFNLFYQGENLENILETAPKHLQFGQKTKNYGVADSILLFESLILNLRGLTPEKLYFHNDSINEADYLKEIESRQSFFALCHYQIYKSQVLYLYEKPSEALHCSLQAKKLITFIPGAFATAEHNFYYSLSLAALYPEVSEAVQKHYWQQLEANQKQMEIWTDNCRENFLHKYLLVEAEIARILGQDLEAIELYDYAIESAKENEFIQNEALANELAAKFWLSRGKKKIAKVYMSEALYGYQRWGAKRKVENIEQKYPQLVDKTASSAKGVITTLTPTTSNSTITGYSVLDLATVIKASEVIYGEILLDKLLAKLMKILIENAGAQKGYLILEKAGKLLIEAAGEVGSNSITVLQSIPISSEASMFLASSIINYVVRTKETVVLNDASREGKFTNDPYISQNQAKSILCTPLMNQGKLISILYLENNLTTGAFTCDRVELLKLLSAQASISIENAQLYNNLQQFNQNLEQLVQERTTELSQTLANLKATQTQLVEAEKMAALGGLVAGVAHEINTPLGIGVTAASVLAGRTTALSEALKSGKMKRSDLEKYLDTATSSTTLILSNLSRAAELIKSFKQVAVDQSCEKQRTFGVKAYLQEILLNLRPKLKRTKLTIEIHGDENLTLESYPGAFSQIVTNLVMNSLIHAYEPEEEGRILLEFQQNNQQFIFQYRDDGKGIPRENLGKIFEPFFTTKRGQGGSGLGLHIIYNLVTQRLKGTIQCESQVGAGTNFLLKFPIQADSEQ